jgi:hypothetical protein
LERKLRGTQSRSGRYREEKNPVLPGIELRPFGLSLQRLSYSGSMLEEKYRNSSL